MLKATLEKEWARIKHALSLFPYFREWSEVAVRECCTRAKLKKFNKDDIILSTYMLLMHKYLYRLLAQLDLNSVTAGSYIKIESITDDVMRKFSFSKSKPE